MSDERKIGPVWGGWWFWEPPFGKSKEETADAMGIEYDKGWRETDSRSKRSGEVRAMSP